MKIRACAAYGLMILVLTANAVLAQRSKPDTLYAIRTHEKIKLDGILDEPVWQTAPHIANFTQRELSEGEPASERTEVAVVYDEENVYIGVWCWDSEPEKIVAKKMNRDFNWRGEDNFEIIIDSYHDRRNSYLFVTNPNGARADVQILDNGRQFNRNWDGVWDAKARKTDQGWFAEFEIPFSTLKFETGTELVWGINFERNIRHKREQVLWQGWSRNSDLEQVSRAGTLVGLHGIENVNLVEVKPYGLAGANKAIDEDADYTTKVGGDLNYLITPTVKLNLTVNTDFAQVESDRARINLSRFSLYYPEKREFFLEGADYFDFGMGRRIQPFYSRRIGISPERTEIPILAGARVLGKMGPSTIGAMSIQTAKKDTFPTANYSVARWKQDVGKQSFVGLIGISKFEKGRQNLTYGTDFLYSTTTLFGDKNFNFGGAYVQSYTSDAVTKTGNAQRLFVSYPSDLIEFDASWERSAAEFNPEVGFLRRRNFQMLYTELQINPRPAFLPWIRKAAIKPVDFNYYIDDDTHELSSFYAEFRPLGFSTKSGEFMEINIQRSAENLKEDFEIQDGILIPAGEYWFTHYEIQFRSFSGRPLFVRGGVNWGDFYDGTRSEWSGRLTWRATKNFSASGDWQRNIIDLPGGDFTTDEVGGRIEVAASPDLFGAVFGQWNNEDNEVLFNLRLNWIPEPGKNLFFVINQLYDIAGGSWKETDTTIATKLVWRFVL